MTTVAEKTGPIDKDWWRGAVIYQIYPRSFFDSNGDGIGDLRGISAKLPYIASLQVDAIWISPFFMSPMKDFGYDVSDFRQVDPMFGTMADFDHLIAEAHSLGLKVIIDQVLSHTSDQHVWFRESRASRDNSKADWYVWADPKPDGTPPNNWLSVFGGSAWHWNTTRRQYYLHNFLTSQPDLNFHCPAVQSQLLDEVEFWLKRGVDGFRFDAANFYFHDRQLRDNPPRDPSTGTDHSTPESNPYSFQRHLWDKTQPENLDFLARLRVLLERYGAVTSLGEIGDDDALGVMAAYTSGGNKLHMAYTFNLLNDNLDARHIRSVVAELESRIGDGWACWSIGNHDAPRVLSRVGGADPSPDLSMVLLALLVTLRGSSCVYQGEELSLTESDVPYEALQDPYGLAFWPEFKGRDGCRTPLPWQYRAPNLGFSSAQPWLPTDPRHRDKSADLQEVHPMSTLNRFRTFMAWRKRYAVFRTGTLRFLDAPADVLTYVRETEDHAVVTVLNLSSRIVSVVLRDLDDMQPLAGHGFVSRQDRNEVTLPPYGAYFGTPVRHRE
jgi:alpha-glucosidase